MSHHHPADRPNHEHRGKTSESLVNKEELLRALNITEGQAVLDAGCGDGYMAREFAKLVKSNGRVYAMDTDESAIENLRKNAGTDIIQPLTGDISRRTALKESSIDLIYISNVLHGFSESQMAGLAGETQRLLKPGGILAILEFKKEEMPVGPPVNIRLSPEELKGKFSLKQKKTVDIGEYLYLQLFQK